METGAILSNIRRLLPYFILYLLAEAIIRFATGLQAVASGNFLEGFYYLKQHTIAYTDANFLALHIQWVMCLLLFLEDYTRNKIWFKYFVILVPLAVLALSRSVVITVGVLLYIRHTIKLLKKKNYLMIVFELMIAALAAMWMYFYFIENDGSFRSKLGILDGMKKIKGYDIANILFGFGFGKGEFAYSYREEGYGHLHIALLIGQYGILGTALVVIFFIDEF
jgi:hypothetical protein